MDRNIADKGRYPAIDILKSVSRMMPDCNTDDENRIVSKARSLLASYEEMADMIRLGAYRKGSDPKIDEAIVYYSSLEEFLSQDKNEKIKIEEGYQRLTEILNIDSSLDNEPSQIDTKSKDEDIVEDYHEDVS